MARSSSKAWFQIPWLGALVMGFGALFGMPARAATPDLTAGGPDEVVVRSDGEKIYISERGGSFQELSLGETPEALRLRKLLDAAGATRGSVSVPVGSIIVANGGSQVGGPAPEAPRTVKAKRPKQPAKRSTRNRQGNGA
jgi:hypothetical protein